jgi:CO dehydrogenase maturation factor
MTITIAVAGKGGVGKTTIAALLIKFLIINHLGPVLAVDADPSSNLNLALGVELDWTIGDIREELLSKVQESILNSGAAMGTLPGYSSKRDYLDYHVRTSLVEGGEFDLIVMGRPEGPGCYCAVNHNIRDVIDSISRNYQYIVIDNEAGMEHLSRRTTRDVNYLFVISDPSLRGLIGAENIVSIANELDINIERKFLVINRVNRSFSTLIQQKIDNIGIPFLGTINSDIYLESIEDEGVPLINIDNNSPIFKSVENLFQPIFLGS